MTLPTLLIEPLLAVLQGTEGAPAEGAGESSGGLFGGSFLVPMLLVIGIFYFVLILPEKKQRKKREAMLGAMQKGDKVVTTAGIHATVAAVGDDVVTLQVADGVRMKFSRAAVQTLVDESGAPKGEAPQPEALKAGS